MGCAASKPATPKQKLDVNAKSNSDEQGRTKVSAQRPPRRCLLTVQQMCISYGLTAFPHSNRGLIAMAMKGQSA